MAKPKTVTREKLYEEVWQTPGRKLAERYGVSDVALAKICRKMNVPRPYRGYWRRVQTGQRPKRTRLVQAKEDTVLVHEFTRRNNLSTASPRRTSKKKKTTEFRNEIVVPERLTNPHPLIKTSRAELKKRRNSYSWDRVYFSRRFLSVIVHPKAEGRAFRIMDAFLKALEARGHRVGISTSYYGGGCAIIFGQEIRFDLRDRDCTLPSDGGKEAAPFAWSWEEGPAKVRRGLVFRVYKSWNNGCGTSHWRDGKRQRLEDLLDGILLLMTHLAQSDRRYQIRSEKWQQEREEQERIRREEEERRLAELRRRRKLIRAAGRWKRSKELVEFVEAMEVAISECDGADETLQWARKVAQEMDPLQAPPDRLISSLSLPQPQ